MSSDGNSDIPLGRRLLPVGIGLAAALALLFMVSYRRRPTAPDAAPARKVPLLRAEMREHEERLAEVHGEEREKFAPVPLERQGPEIDGAPDLSAEERARRKREWQKAMDAVAEADATSKEIRREFQDYAQSQRARIQDTPKKEEEKKAALRLTVDAAANRLLPGQSLVARVSLVNEGEDATVRTSLHPLAGYLRAAARAPGSDRFGEIPFTFIVSREPIPEENAPRLPAGGRWSLHGDLPLDLGLDRASGLITPGTYTVRLELTILGREKVVSDEFAVTVETPTGADDTVYKEIVSSGLFGFLGPAASAKSDPPKGGLPAAWTAVEGLCRRFPGSRYAADLRAGFVLAGLDRMALIAPSPEARIDADRRLAGMCKEMLAKDAPASWARAEILLLAARCAVRVKDLPFTKDEMLARFRALCPNDIRNRD